MEIVKENISKSEQEDFLLASADIWKDIKETGEEYQKRMRNQWKKRQKRIDYYLAQ